MFGWLKPAVMRASSRNIRTISSSAPMSGRIRLSTTSLRKPATPRWNARKISAIPPVESRQTTSYLPSFRPLKRSGAIGGESIAGEDTRRRAGGRMRCHRTPLQFRAGFLVCAVPVKTSRLLLVLSALCACSPAPLKPKLEATATITYEENAPPEPPKAPPPPDTRADATKEVLFGREIADPY